MPRLTVTELERDELAKAWPLVRAVSASRGVEEWEQSASELIARGGGVIGVVAQDGCLHGVATYRPIGDGKGGRILYLETLVTFELSRRAPVRQLLCDRLERLASVLGCDSIAVSMPVGSLPKNWRSAGWLAGGAADPAPSPGIMLS
jgi:hypothetical protein